MELEKKPHEICAQNELQDLRIKSKANYYFIINCYIISL